MIHTVRCLALLGILTLASVSRAADGFTPLFPTDGVPAGWRAMHWTDVSQPAAEGATWRVEDGVLHGSETRGTWLVSERQYGDFALQYEFKLGERGNSGCGLRFPPAGDPAFDGVEIQMVDARYYGDDPPRDSQRTASIYPVIAPSKQLYRPEDWNRMEITCRGSHIQVKLNGQLVQDENLDDYTGKLNRGAPLAERPRRGHIGFQELSRGGGHVQIRGARLKELD